MVLAGISFAEIALQNNKSIFVLITIPQPSSKVFAGGLYNPVVLKDSVKYGKQRNKLILLSLYTIKFNPN